MKYFLECIIANAPIVKLSNGLNLGLNFEYVLRNRFEALDENERLKKFLYIWEELIDLRSLGFSYNFKNLIIMLQYFL